MTLMRYEPFNLLNQLQREVNRLFDTNRFGDEETGHALADWGHGRFYQVNACCLRTARATEAG